MDEDEILKLQKRREEALPFPESRVGSDSFRGGRQGLDYEADERLLPLDSYNRRRLTIRLGELVNEHRWSEAAGVVSVLLRALSWWEAKSANSRPIFTMAMEVLRHLEGTKSNSMRFRKLFNLMHVYQSSFQNLESKRLRGRVQLELALFLIHLNDYDGAYNVLRPIVDVPPFRDDAAANLCYGLIVHRLWYEKAVEDVEAEAGEESSEQGSFSGEWLPRTANNAASTAVCPERVETVYIGGEQMEVSENEEIDSLSSEVSMDRSDRIESSTFQLRNRVKESCYEDDEEFLENAVVNISPDMDSRLFPVRLPYVNPNCRYVVPMLNSRIKELHSSAVKHLQQAAASEFISALIPFVQLLLAADDVEGAYKEIEICYQATHHISALSLKALVLESLSTRDPIRLSKVYEDILHHNPSSADAISSLLNMHNSGEYGTEALIQSIAVHLDAEEGSVNVWHKLADCFLEISYYVNEVKEEEQVIDLRPENLVYSFLDRAKHWLIKHFSKLQSPPLPANYWKRITYKAACAAHMYGCENFFVGDVCDFLTTHKQRRLAAVLALHCEKALCLVDA